MRSIVSIAAVAAVSSLALAQTTILPQNKIRAWDQTTEYTTRGSNGGAAGFVSQAFTPGMVRGWGDISYIQYVLQDWDAATQDPIDIMFVRLNAKGLPDYAKGVVIGTVNLPTSPGGNQAYLVTHNMNGAAPNNPFKLPTMNEQWHFAWSLKDKPAAKWTTPPSPTDGQSVHMSNAGAQLPAGTGILCTWDSASNRVYHREIPRQEMVLSAPVQIKEELGWTSNPPAPSGPLDPSSNDRSYRLDLGTTTPALSVAVDNLVYNGKPTGATISCPNPNTGYAGLDPDFNHNAATGTHRYDNPVWKVESGAANANGVALLFWSQALLPKNGIAIFGGNFILDLTDILFKASPSMAGAVINLDTSGAGSFNLNLGNATSRFRPIASSFPNWHAQALIVHATAGIHWTNLATMRPMMAPAKFVAATVDNTAPADHVRPSGSQTFFIRNDGRGELKVQMFVKTQHFPAFDVIVPERCSMNVRIFGATTNIKVLASFSKSTNYHYMFDY